MLVNNAKFLAITVTTHPALSDFAILPYDILAAESRVTNAPMIGAPADATVENPDTILTVTFTYDFATADEFVAAVSPTTKMWNAVPGLVWKTWKLNAEPKRAGAVYNFESAKAAQAYLESELAAVATHPNCQTFVL